MNSTEILTGVDESWLPLFDLPALDAALARVGGAPTSPAAELVFEAFRYGTPETTHTVIVGQDPYPNDAQGICFSVQAGVAVPDSLKRVFGCLERAGLRPPHPSGDLRSWAAQGVLMVNTAFTTQVGVRLAHADAWAAFFRGFLEALCRARAGARPLHFLLWGAQARAHAPAAQKHGHVVHEWTHPSPVGDNRLAPDRRFRACPHFEEVNAALSAAGERPVVWNNAAAVVAMTDGSCPRNGKPGARAGFAAVLLGGPFQKTVIRGEAAAAEYRLAGGRVAPADGGPAVAPSNNRGEMLGIIYAFLAVLHAGCAGRVEVVSDSEICVKTLLDWLPKRLAKKTENELKNLDLVMIAWELLGRLRGQASAVAITHVNSHQPAPPAGAPARDRLVHGGNRLADEHAGAMAAGDGAPAHRLEVPPYPHVLKRLL